MTVRRFALQYKVLPNYRCILSNTCLEEWLDDNHAMPILADPLRRAARACFLVFFPGLVLLSPAPCPAGLKWENLQVNESVWVGDKSQEAVFRFRNTGTGPVSITSVQPSCGCTTITLGKTTYAPGEAGELKAILDTGNVIGQQTKLITVISSDAPARPTKLVLGVNVRALATVNPTFVFWRVGERDSEKRVEITANTEQTITGVDAVPMNPDLQARIEQVEQGKRYILWLSPKSTAAAMKVLVPCVVRTPRRLQPTVAVYASVLR